MEKNRENKNKRRKKNRKKIEISRGIREEKRRKSVLLVNNLGIWSIVIEIWERRNRPRCPQIDLKC